jgi:hypothetical protein
MIYPGLRLFLKCWCLRLPGPDKPEGFRRGFAGASLLTRVRTSAGKTLRKRLYKPRVFPAPKDISPVNMCGCYPALSVCISDAHIRPIGAISDWILHDQRWWISTITSDGKSNEFPNTLVCPYVISDFYEPFPMILCYVPKVINTACFPSEIQQVWYPFIHE